MPPRFVSFLISHIAKIATHTARSTSSKKYRVSLIWMDLVNCEYKYGLIQWVVWHAVRTQSVACRGRTPLHIARAEHPP
jgi:hypothetical protein